MVARRIGGRTRLAELSCRPPLQVMRAHHLDPALPDMAFVIVASPGGGVLQGDRLHMSVEVEAGARLHLDTSSATRLYRMPRGEAGSEVRLHVGPGACLELVPDPYLPYAGARFRQATRAVVHETGVLLLGEVVAAGRAARGEELRYERFESLLEVSRPSGTLLSRDACRLAPGDGLDAPGLLGSGRPVVGTLHVVAAGFGPDPLAGALETADRDGVYWGASELPNGAGAWMRVLAPDVATACAAVHGAWCAARRALLGAEPPRSRRY
ncbi:MAG TPA: urease accessory protein UreD [Candidatus Dormibacteraeota bacterium]|jgi:urease accessory protein